MKKSLLLFLCILSHALTGLHAKVKSYTCLELFEREVQIQVDLRDKRNNRIGLSSLGAVVPGSIAAQIPPVGAIITVLYMGTAMGLYVANNIKSAEERALALTTDSSKKYKRFAKRLKNKFPHIDDQDILSVIDHGYESGDFCSDTQLMRPHQMKDYIHQKLANMNESKVVSEVKILSH